MGSSKGGLVPVGERWAHEVAVPDFEIDSQAVNRSQYSEFVLDQGYDRPELWGDEGWAWVQQQQRRSPLFGGADAGWCAGAPGCRRATRRARAGGHAKSAVTEPRPGAGQAPPGDLDAAFLGATLPAAGQPGGVLRGGSFATQPRWLHPKARRFAARAADTPFTGFRSRAV